MPIGADNTVEQIDHIEELVNALTTDNDASVSLAELKKIAQPIYDRLIAVGYTAGYPWPVPTPPADDAAPVTVAQAEQWFRFDWSFPLVVLGSPRNGGSYPEATDVYVSATASVAGDDSRIAKVEFFADHTKIGETLHPPFGIDWKQPATGTYQIVATATDRQGATATTHAATISVVSSAPKVALFSDAPAFTQAHGKLHARIVGVKPTDLKNMTLNGKSVPPKTGQFELEVQLVEGNNPFTLVATDSQGRKAQASITVLCDTLAPKVAITEPKENISLGVSRVNVKGTISDASAIASLSVNGNKAFVKDGHFEVLNVPIAPGANSLTVQAIDIAGNRATASCTVNGVGSSPEGKLRDPVILRASPRSGFTGLSVTFLPRIEVPGKIQEVGYDFDGDNVIDEPTTTARTPVTHAYTMPGEFFPVLTVKTTEGSFSSVGGANFNPFAGWLAMAKRTGEKPDDDSGWPLTIRVSASPQIHPFVRIANPVDLAVDHEGNLYVLSRDTATITEFNKDGKQIRSLAGVGTKPCGIDVDEHGNVYVALTGNNQVARLKPTAGSFEFDVSFTRTGKIGNADQSAGKGDGSFDAPYDVVVDRIEDAIYVSDTNNSRIVKYSLSGQFERAFGSVGNSPQQFDHPKGLCFGGSNYLTYVADTGNHRVVVIGNDSVRRTVGSAGSGEGQFNTPLNLAVNEDGVYVADAGDNRLQAFDASRSSGETGNPFLDFLWSIDTKAGFRSADAVACAPDLLGTTLYLADAKNDSVFSIKISRGEPPEAVWNQMKKRMAAHDIEGALAFFSEDVQDNYRHFFQSSGQEKSAKFVEDAGKISVISIEKDEAEYNIEQSVAGKTISFPVRFVRVNGKWKIQEF